MFLAELHSWTEEGNGRLVSGKLVRQYIDSGAAFEKLLAVRASDHDNVISLGVHVFNLANQGSDLPLTSTKQEQPVPMKI